MKKIKFSLLLFILIIVNSCRNYDNEVSFLVDIPDYVALGTIDKGSHLIVLYQKSERQNLNVGYNDLYLLFRDSDRELTISEIDYSTKTYLEDGSEKFYGATFPSKKSDLLKLFKVPTYFTHNINSIDNWTFEINYTFKNVNYTESMTLEVSENQFFSKFEHNNKKYYISQIQPTIQKIGVLDFDFTIIEQEGENFAYANNFNTSILVTNGVRETENNVAPKFTKDGYYKGTIYVPETGAWQVECGILYNQDTIHKYYYPIIVKLEE